MAEIVRIAESASNPRNPTLPQNIEAEAALLGALMIDNRLVEDVQLKLRAAPFLRAAARPDLRSDPAHDRRATWSPTRSRCGRCSRPTRGSRRSAARPISPSSPARARRSSARAISPQQIYDLALLRALIGVGRELVEGALDTSEEIAPLAQIEKAETELYKVAEEGGAEGKAKSFGEATKDALEMAERALNSGGHLSGLTTGLDSLNSKIGGLHPSDLIIVAGRPGMGKTALGTNIGFAAAAALPARPGGRASSRRNRPAHRSPCSASKCRPTSSRRESSPSNRESVPRTCAWARSASRISASWRAPRPSSRACRSTSTTRRA